MKTLFKLVMICAVVNVFANVTVNETQMSIPSYKVNEPDPTPMFYLPENYQNAQLRIYPYANIVNLTQEKIDKEYTALILENEYLELCVLPEIGGRFYYAKDKTNSYDIIYHNKVIKPALIGMTGAWVSGGIEWNIPHHHRASSFMPVDYKIEDHPDGSKTVWVGEYEKRHEMRWMVGLTLYPGKAYVQIDMKLMNVTPHTQTFLMWANTAVEANEQYQVVFPPDCERATYHTTNDFSDWPISHQMYNGIDFTEGVDISWWKNIKWPTSFFVYGSEMDFVAGIDHGKNAGSVQIGNHHQFIGSKAWYWGNNPIARLWDQMLTDDGSTYLELMFGLYSNNQPDYSWIQPYSEKSGTMYLTPVRDLTHVKNATKDAAVNLDFVDDKIIVEAYSTAAHKNAAIKLSCNETVVFEEKLSINPAKPFSKELPFDKNEKTLYKLELTDSNGKQLVFYQPPEPKNNPTPEPYRAPSSPEEMTSADDLYLAGLRLEQFANPYFDPMVYYEKALERNPDHFLTHTQLGQFYLKKYNYDKAEVHLQKAVDVLTDNHTTPKYAEALYNLGLCFYLQDECGKAEKYLERAAWYDGWASASNFLLASIHAINGNADKALLKLDFSLDFNSKNSESLQAKLILSKQAGLSCEALIDHIKAIDPLNAVVWNENRFGENILRDEVDNYLQLSFRYAQLGFFGKAADVLTFALESSVEKNPLIFYYLAYYHNKLGDEKLSQKYINSAEKMSLEFCFPHGAVSEKILRWAANDKNAKANYLLGTVYADTQPEKALEHWQYAVDLKLDFPMVYRSMAFVQANILGDVKSAALNIDKACKLDPSNIQSIHEADAYYEFLQESPQKRHARLLQYPKHLKNGVLLIRKILLDNVLGDYDTAIHDLSNNHFYVAELSTVNPHHQWVNAYMYLGIEKLKRGDYESANDDFIKMKEFPRNLETATDAKAGLADVWLGISQSINGDREKAVKSFNAYLNADRRYGWGGYGGSIMTFYAAISYKALGKNDQFEKLVKRMLINGKNKLTRENHTGRDEKSVRLRHNKNTSKADAYFSMALSNLLQGDEAGFDKNINEALKFDNANVDILKFKSDAKLMEILENL